MVVTVTVILRLCLVRLGAKCCVCIIMKFVLAFLCLKISDTVNARTQKDISTCP